MNSKPYGDNLMTGREMFLKLLISEGVTHLFGNPGTTELPIMHALRDVPDLTYVLGLQESIVVAMADGFARASGQLVSCNVHVAPGLGNAMGSLYTASFTGTPMILTAGQQEQGHGLTEPLLFGPLVQMAEPLVKWAVEVTRLEDLPRILHRAAKIATTAPTGPVFISLPGDILNDEGPFDLGKATRVETETQPSDRLLDRASDLIVAASNPIILAGHEVVTSDCFDQAAQFSDLIGAPVYQQTVPHGAHFPSEHRFFMGDLSRDQRHVRDKLSEFDLIISLGADILRMSVYSPVEPLPENLKVLHIGLNDWEMGKNFAADLALRANLRTTVETLMAKLSATASKQLAARADRLASNIDGRNWNARKAAKLATAAAKADCVPLDPDWLMHHLVTRLPEDAIVVDEGLVTARPLLSYLPFRDRHSYFGNASGGIGWAIAAAVGIQLAKPDRRVVAVIGDGSSMYSIQSLWSAAHLSLPITFIIANNGGYRIIKERLRAFHGSEHYIGMDFTDPEIDFAGLSQSLGMAAVRAESAEAFDAALTTAFAGTGPMLIEAMVEKGP